MQWQTDSGSPYTAGKSIYLATAFTLVACFTPVRNLDSSGLCESVVKTLKCDTVRVNWCSDSQFVLHNLPAWLEDGHTVHPHSGLRLLSPREFLAKPSFTPAACTV